MATKKSTTTPAKTASKTASKSASKTPTKAPAKKPAAAEAAAMPAHAAAAKKAPTQEEIRRLAHQYWQEGGHGHGSHEDDWHRAEQELKSRS